MITINKKYFYLIFFVIVFSIVLFTIKSYSGVNAVMLQNVLLKYQIENIVLFAVIEIIIITLGFSFLIYRSINLEQVLDRSIDLVKNSSSREVELNLQKSGDIGNKINKLLAKLSELNRLKTLKISALTNIIEYYIRNSKNMTFLLDAVGNIEAVNESFVEENQLKENIFQEKSIASFIEDFNFNELLLELRKSYAPVYRKSLKFIINDREFIADLVFIPVINRINQITFIICTQANKDIVISAVHEGIRTVVQKSSPENILDKYYKKFISRIK